MKICKIDRALLTRTEALTEGQRLDCIVKAYDYDRLKKFLLHKKIEIRHEYLFIKSLHLKVTKKELLSLAQLTQVAFIYSLSCASALMQVSRKVLEVDKLDLSGKGVTVAFIDTGIHEHCDFIVGENRIVFFKDFIHDRKSPYDDNGHGTFVSGVCAGNGSLSGGKFSGIAPAAKIISLKALNGDGEASADKILQAMEWVYLHHREYSIKVVCMSFGSEPIGFNDPIMAGSEALWNEGVVVVAAAGNSGPEFQTIKSPGVSSQIITVGGFDDNRLSDEEFKENFFEIASFSSRGPAFQRFKPDLVAPSVDITSCAIKTPYTKLSGTSVATPMIAGLCALLLEDNPKLSPREIKKLLLSSCKAISFNKNLEGFGYPILAKILKKEGKIN